METIHSAVQILALIWGMVMFFLYVTSGNPSEKDDRFSSCIILASMTAFLPAVQYGTNAGETGVGFFAAGYPYVSYTGFLLIALGVAIHADGIITLNKQWSPMVVIREEHLLVKNGVYRYIRHPIYAGIFLELLGFGLALSNWISLLALLLPNVVSISYRIHIEERALRRYFGSAYTSYARTTKRLIPWVY